MVATSTVAVALVAGLCGLGALLLGRRWWVRGRDRSDTADRRVLERTLEERLAETMGPGTGTHLERAPTVRRLAVVDTAETGTGEREALVPVVRVDLGTVDPPGPTLRFEYVAAVLEAIHPVFVERDERVHCYDIEFAFGPGGLLVGGECRRVSVAPEMAARCCEDDGFRTVALRRAVTRADRDDETPTTAWGVPRDASRWQRALAESNADDTVAS